MKLLLFFLLFFAFLETSCDAPKGSEKVVSQSINFVAEGRNNRSIPIQIYCNSDKNAVNNRLAVINPGYKGEKTNYSFLAKKLAENDYTVDSIQHDLPTNDPIANTGNLYELRMPVWERGVQNVQFVIAEIKKQYPNLDYQNLILIGHSMGGDISMLFSQKYPEQVSAITLDHQRMPIPRTNKPRILSIRADEVEADKGLLPTEDEQKTFGIKIVNLKNTKHADLSDAGSTETKKQVSAIILEFLKN